MLTLSAELYNLSTNEETTVFKRASNIYQMRGIVASLEETFSIQGFTMVNRNVGINLSQYDKIAWEAGNRGINAGACLNELIEETVADAEKINAELYA